MASKNTSEKAGAGIAQQNDKHWIGNFGYNSADLGNIFNTSLVPKKVQYLNQMTSVAPEVRRLFLTTGGNTFVDESIIFFVQNAINAGVIDEEDVRSLRFGYITCNVNPMGAPKKEGESTAKKVAQADAIIFTIIDNVAYLVCEKKPTRGAYYPRIKWFEFDTNTHEMSDIDWYNLGYDDDYAVEHTNPDWKVPEDRTVYKFFGKMYATLTSGDIRNQHCRPTKRMVDVAYQFADMCSDCKDTDEFRKFLDRLDDPEELSCETAVASVSEPKAYVASKASTQVTDINDFINQFR